MKGDIEGAKPEVIRAGVRVALGDIETIFRGETIDASKTGQPTLAIATITNERTKSPGKPQKIGRHRTDAHSIEAAAARSKPMCLLHAEDIAHTG